MAGKADIGAKIGIDGAAEFKKQINDIDSSLKVLGSEMKIVTAEFGRNAKTEEALTKQNEILERRTIELKNKLELQTKALIEQVNATSEADETSKRMQIAVNNTTAELAKAEKQLKDNASAIDKLGEETEESGAEFKNAGKEAASFGDVLKANVLGDLIIKGVEALATGVKKLGKAFKDAIVDGAAYADEIATMSAQSGLSTDTLQEFKYMADLMDVDLNTITGALSKLTKNMNSARKGTGDTAAAFEKLDVNITNADGSLRDNEAVFNDTLEALGNVANETERDALAMQIFGKSAQELNPLIVAGVDTIAQYAQEAHDMGYVLDSEALESLNNVQDSFDRLHAATDGVKNQLAQALAPTIEEVAGKLQNWIAGVNWEDVSAKINNVADGIKTFFSFVSENGDTIIAILAGIAAGFVAWNVTEMVMGLVGAIMAFQTANEGATIAQAALNAVMNANPIGIIITALSALVAAIIVLWNTNEDFRNWVLQAWEDVKNWIKKAVEDVVNWITQAWEDIKSFFKNAPKWFIDIGTNIVKGIWEGIKNAASWLIGKITGFFNDIVSGVKNILGIRSPSRVFAEIGRYMAEGLGEGWEEGAKPVFQKVVDDIKAGYTKAFDSARGTINSQIKLFDDFAAAISEDTNTAEKMLERWATQTENLSKYTENLKRAAEYGLDKGLIESLSDGSAQSAGYLSTIIQKIEGLGAESAEAAAFINDFNAGFSATASAKDDFAQTVASMRDEIGYELSQMPEEWLTAGEDMVNSMIEGLDMESSSLYNKVTEIVKNALYKARESIGTLLPTSSANAGVISAMQGTGVTNAMAESVNALGALSGASQGDLTIQMVIDGREFSRAILPDFRLVQAQNPIIVNDF